MIEISKTLNDNGEITLAVKGNLSAAESEEFGAAAEAALTESSKISMDLTDLNYIASAGLRVIVLTQKNTVKNGGFLKLLNVKQDVMEVFEVTGLNNILAFE